MEAKHLRVHRRSLRLSKRLVALIIEGTMKTITMATTSLLLVITATTLLAFPLSAETPQERCKAAMQQETWKSDPTATEYEAEMAAAKNAYHLCRSASIAADLRALSARRYAMSLKHSEKAEKESVYRNAIRDIQKTDGSDSSALLPLLSGLMDFTFHVSGGPNAETFTIAHEISRISKKAFGSESEPAAKALVFLAYLNQVNGSRVVAETLYREAIAAAQAACAPKCKALAEAYGMLGQLITEDPARRAEADDLDNRAFEAIPDEQQHP